jgi:hypothetical protein
MKPPLSLAPDLEAVLDWPAPDMTPIEISESLGFHRVTIRAAIKAGHIGGRAHQLRAGETTGGEASRSRLRVPKAEVIAYLWRIHTGDRALMRRVLGERAPALLAELERGAELPAGELPALPANVIASPMASRRVRAAVPLVAKDHPELRLFA